MNVLLCLTRTLIIEYIRTASKGNNDSNFRNKRAALLNSDGNIMQLSNNLQSSPSFGLFLFCSSSYKPKAPIHHYCSTWREFPMENGCRCPTKESKPM